MKIRAGDNVVIISGKDKGKTGTVLKVLHEINRVVVSDANMRTKHVKKTANRAGQIVHYEASLHLSNVMIIDPKTKKRSRIGFSIDEKGRKNRISKKSGEVVKAVKASSAKKGVQEAKDASKKPKKESKQETTGSEKKAPFWKKVGFGADALEEAAEVKEPARMKQDQRPPEETRTTESFSHSRGK